MEDRLVPTRLGADLWPWHGENERDPIVMVTTGQNNTLVVTEKGSLWGWGGEIALCNVQGNQSIPLLLGTAEEFGGANVLFAACGLYMTVILTVDGNLWSLGDASNGRSFDFSVQSQRVPARIVHACKFVSVSAFHRSFCAVTTEGKLYEWGELPPPATSERLPKERWVNTRPIMVEVPRPSSIQTLYEARVGHCHFSLPQLFMLAFAMGTHGRLGGGVGKRGVCLMQDLSVDVLRKISVAGGPTKPPGTTGLRPEMMRLLGGHRTLDHESEPDGGSDADPDVGV
jgi:hypothetical protein